MKDFEVGDWIIVELDGARGVIGEVTKPRNEYRHGVLMVREAIGYDAQEYIGHPFAFTYGPHVRKRERLP